MLVWNFISCIITFVKVLLLMLECFFDLSYLENSE